MRNFFSIAQARVLAATVFLGFFMFVFTVFAAPVKNEAARNYLANADQNYWSTQALYVLAESQISDSHLRSVSCSSAIQCAGPIMGIAALGQDPRVFASNDIVAQLSSFHSNGQLGDMSLLNDDIFGILALRAAGVSVSDAIISDSKNYLLNNQNIDGGFGFMLGASDVDDTAMAITALIEAGVDTANNAITKAIQYINDAQNDDGGFPYDPVSPYGTDSNANSTAWVVSMIYKIGQNPEYGDWIKNGQNPVTYLQSLQTSEGWFEYQKNQGNFLPIDTTAQVAIALAGASYPVRKITYTIPIPPPPAGMIFPGGSSAPVIPPVINAPDIKKSEPETPDSDSEAVKKNDDAEPETELEKEPSKEAQSQEEPDAARPYPDGSLLKTKNNPTVYLIENGRKRWIPNEDILKLSFALYEIDIVEQSVLELYPEGLAVSYPDGVYLKERETRKVYRIKNGKLYHILSLNTWHIIQNSKHPFVANVDAKELQGFILGGVVN